MKISFLVLFLSLSSFAEEKCLFDKTAEPKLTWTAFKTPKKVGVKGTFEQITYKSTEAKSLKDFLLSTSIEIDANSVKSGDDTRDEKLQKFFFKLMKTKTIKAKIQTVNDTNVLVLLSMNGIKKELTMNYTFANNLITLTATMDVMDWSLGKALDSINKACAALHENKTWSDVNLTVEVPASLECHAKI